MMELKIKGLQAQLRTFKEREEEREREQAEPWALRLKNAPAESPSAASVGGLFVAAGGGQVVEFLPSAASMQEECCKMCESCGTRDTLWLIAFSFDRREVVESLSRAQNSRGQHTAGSGQEADAPRSCGTAAGRAPSGSPRR